MKKILGFGLLILFFGCSSEGGDGAASTAENNLTIAVAASLQFVMPELVDAFENETGAQCELIFGSSGKLMAQIKEGAPYDVFVSANMKYPYALFDSGITSDQPKVFALGQLVLWSNSPELPPSLDILTQDEIKHIALPNEQVAPYGQAAYEVLINAGIYSEVKEKLVFGENVSQTNQFILSGAAEIGFTALSIVLSPEMQPNGTWKQLEVETYSPIENGVVRINQSSDLAARFVDFLSSTEAQLILAKFGYLYE